MPKAIKDPTKQVWYTRRDKQIRGPFPAGMIRRHILLGRILETDELSIDQRHWERVADIWGLIPEEMKADLSLAENQEKLKIAILREDERSSGDRRQSDSADSADAAAEGLRRRDERREQESAQAMSHRQFRTALADSLKPKVTPYRSGVIVLTLVIGLIIWAAIAFTGNRHHPMINVKCQSIAAPQADWSHCNKNGIDLADANLAGAKLTFASLREANLQRATLVGANLEHGNFSGVKAAAVNLQFAKLNHAIFHGADLHGADLRNTDLSFVVFYDADLTDARLSGANLTHAVLNNARLDRADFTDAILDKAIWSDNSVCAPESLSRCIPLSMPPPAVSQSEGKEAQ